MSVPNGNGNGGIGHDPVLPWNNGGVAGFLSDVSRCAKGGCTILDRADGALTWGEKVGSLVGEYGWETPSLIPVVGGLYDWGRSAKQGDGTGMLVAVGTIALDLGSGGAEGTSVRAGLATERIAAKLSTAPMEVVTKTNRLKAHILNGELDAARREAAGEVVARKADGTPWDHVQELRDAQRGLLNRIDSINRQLSRNVISDTQRFVLQRELSEASKLLDKTEGFLPR